jgi:hypothetical protein
MRRDKRARPIAKRRLGSTLLACALVASVAALAHAGLPVAPLSKAGHLRAAPPPGKLGPEQVPIPTGKTLALPVAVFLGETIDGITCQSSEKVAYHIHAHLTIFARGKAFQVPYGIGIGPPLGGVRTAAGAFVDSGSCFMWLHTHVADGVIHIESPVLKTYSLGQFFAVWGQKLSRTRVGPQKGTVTAFYNGKDWTGNPAAIPLTATAQIQLDIGSPVVAPEHIKFPSGLAATIAPQGSA